MLLCKIQLANKGFRLLSFLASLCGLESTVNMPESSDQRDDYPEMFVEERRRYILQQLQDGGRVTVNGMSEALRVSPVTIRQDLRALEQSGLIERTYGGAVLRETKTILPEMSFHVRQGKRQRGKEAISARAAALIAEGDTVALDASSTVHALVPHLKQFAHLTIVTNSLITAQSFLDSPHITVLMPGGRLRRDSISIVGSPEGLPDVNLNIGFFGARGISWEAGVTDVDGDEIAIKQAMFKRAVRAVILVDGSKWGEVAPYTFLPSDEVRHVITTRDAPKELVGQFKRHSARVDVLSSR